MESSDLLHRYFDGDLDDTHEDVLFERLASDAELRREFAEHMRLHAVVERDRLAITPPSDVTRALFVSLGLRIRGKGVEHTFLTVDAARAVLRKGLPFIVTAFATALLTMSIFYIRDSMHQTGDTPSPVESGTRAKHPAESAREDRPALLQQPSPRHDSGPDAHPSGSELRNHMTAFPPATAPSREGRLPSETGESTHPGRQDPIASITAAARMSKPLSTTIEPTRLPVVQDIRRRDGVGEDPSRAAGMVLFDRPDSAVHLSFLDVGMMRLRPPATGRTLLSHLIVELRMMRGVSYPSVNLPDGSHDIFRDMAIGVLYELSETHAVGIEYGRETFGQEFASGAFVEGRQLPGPVELVRIPPVPSLAAEYRRNRMLDWYGAVWKFSFPGLVLLRSVFPYAQSFVGATSDGPLARLRIGFDVAPTEFTMLNIGIEGTMLRYTVEGAWYQTYKLGGTVGLAVAF